MISGSFKSLVGILNQYTRAGGAAQRVFELMDSLPDIDPNAGMKLNRTTMQGNITIEDVSFAYQSRAETPVLSKVNLDIKAGSVVALVGARYSIRTISISTYY